MIEAVKERFGGGEFPVRIRIGIGISSSPVVAGVIERNKFSYALWGDTANTASRMESYGEPGAIEVSAMTYKLLEPLPAATSPRLKGKGDLTAWVLNGRIRRKQVWT